MLKTTPRAQDLPLLDPRRSPIAQWQLSCLRKEPVTARDCLGGPKMRQQQGCPKKEVADARVRVEPKRQQQQRHPRKEEAEAAGSEKSNNATASVDRAGYPKTCCSGGD